MKRDKEYEPTTFDALLAMIALMMSIPMFFVVIGIIGRLAQMLFIYSLPLFSILYLAIFFGIIFYLVRKQKHAS